MNTTSIFILVMVFWLKGGATETQNVIAHSLEDCTQAERLIPASYRAKGVLKIDTKDVPILQLDSYCIEFNRKQLIVNTTSH